MTIEELKNNGFTLSEASRFAGYYRKAHIEVTYLAASGKFYFCFTPRYSPNRIDIEIESIEDLNNLSMILSKIKVYS